MFTTITFPLEYIYRRPGVIIFLVQKLYNNFIFQKFVFQFFVRFLLMLIKQLILYYQLGLLPIFSMHPTKRITSLSTLFLTVRKRAETISFQIFSWSLQKRNIRWQWFKLQGFTGMSAKVDTFMDVKFNLKITYFTDVSLIISSVVFVKRRSVFARFYWHYLLSFH